MHSPSILYYGNCIEERSMIELSVKSNIKSPVTLSGSIITGLANLFA